MDSLMIAYKSLAVLNSLGMFAVTLFALLVGVVFAAMAANYLRPFVPSEARTSKRHENYVRFQARLLQTREARRARVTIDAGYNTTRRVIEDDSTVPDLALQDALQSTRVSETVVVGEPSAPFTQPQWTQEQLWSTWQRVMLVG